MVSPADDGLVIELDLGDNHGLTYTSWSPDRALNPQYANIPDVERYGAIVTHLTATGTSCRSAIRFIGPVQQQLEPNKPAWHVDAWEPLTLSPSLLCTACGDHGYIRDGRWVRA